MRQLRGLKPATKIAYLLQRVKVLEGSLGAYANMIDRDTSKARAVCAIADTTAGREAVEQLDLLARYAEEMRRLATMP